MIAITTSSQKEAFPLAGRLSQSGTRNTWHRPRLHMCSRLAGGVGAAYHGARKGYRDAVQSTAKYFAPSAKVTTSDESTAYVEWEPESHLTKVRMNGNIRELHQAAYLQPAQALCRRNSHAQTRERSAIVANSLIISKTCAAGGWEAKLGGSLSLKAPTKFVATCTPGIQRNVRRSFPVNQQITDKKKGRTANPTLWNGCFSSHEENQQSTVLGDARSPDLAYGDYRSATLLYEQNHHLATQQDSYAELTREAYETFVGQSSGNSLSFLRCSAFSLRPQASNTQAEKLALGLSGLSHSTLSSMLSISSWGKRICFKYERLFLFPVAIFLRSMLLVIYTPYSKFANDKTIDVHTPFRIRYTHTLSTGKAQITKPGSALTLTGPLTTNDRMSIEVAMFDHTTHPQGRNSLTRNKFTWRFLALSRSDSKAIPCRLSVEAYSEREARQVLAPHFILSLAARLPLQGGVEITSPSTIEKTSTPSTVSKIEMEVTHA